MINEQIVGYVATERARGVADEAIRGALLAQGWREEDVAVAMGGGVLAVSSSPREFSFGNLFEGRLGRWKYFVTGLLFGLTLGLAGMAIGITSFFVYMELNYMSYLIYLVALPLSLSLSIRRAHDIGWSGWTTLLFLVPLVGFIVALIFLFKKGTEGVNAYGAPQSDRPFLRTLLNT